jgi:hypothetical protein
LVNDGTTVYRLTGRRARRSECRSSPWYFQKNPFDAYALNSITAKKSADGGVTVQFGGCDGRVPNCLPIMDGWNYMVRLYRPRGEVLNGTWTFPEAQPVN